MNDVKLSPCHTAPPTCCSHIVESMCRMMIDSCHVALQSKPASCMGLAGMALGRRKKKTNGMA